VRDIKGILDFVATQGGTPATGQGQASTSGTAVGDTEVDFRRFGGYEIGDGEFMGLGYIADSHYRATARGKSF
jgi:hypothetical protein